jgi:pimeloyl-ACP methyl ester carboxylesterase
MRFVLVHGGFHGAWCWERTIAELERLGHEAVAIDLPGHGERVDEPSDIVCRCEAITSVMATDDVLVGHSGGGFDITIAADAAPERVGHLVYLAAGLPLEGRSMPEALMYRPEDTAVEGTEVEEEQFGADAAGMLKYLTFRDDGAVFFTRWEDTRELFYHDCDEATARWAFERLTPELAGDTATEPVRTPRFWAADLPRSFVRCLQDHAQPRWLSDLVAARLGVEPLTIDTSHSPFLSRPAELAERLVEATATRPVGPLRPDS